MVTFLQGHANTGNPAPDWWWAVWVAGASASATAVLVAIPVRAWRRLWRILQSAWLYRTAKWLFWEQWKHPERYIHTRNPTFTFLPLRGGGNITKMWEYGIELVSCLPRHVALDAIELEVLNADYASIKGETATAKVTRLDALTVTSVPRGFANLRQ